MERLRGSRGRGPIGGKVPTPKGLHPAEEARQGAPEPVRLGKVLLHHRLQERLPLRERLQLIPQPLHNVAHR
eukprot:9767814-Lingulodinium_polyedra.AAC.1